METAKGHAVYVVKDGKAELRNIEVGDWQGKDGWLITSGLKSGEEVVVKGINKLREGALVKIVQQSITETQAADPASQTAQ